MSVEVNRKNIMAMKAFSEQTRDQLRTCQLEIENLTNLVVTQQQRIDLFQGQVQILQQKLYTGGATA